MSNLRSFPELDQQCDILRARLRKLERERDALRAAPPDVLAQLDRAAQDVVLTRLDETLRGAKALPFLESLVTAPARIATAKQLAHVKSSTFLSAFWKAGLPSPKAYLARVRLIRTHAVVDGSRAPFSRTAEYLEYSSTAALSRHVRLHTGLRLHEWRDRQPTAVLIDEFFATLILPFHDRLMTFDPALVTSRTPIVEKAA